jgi:hypothetical protein
MGSGFFGSQTSSITFVNGDTVLVPSGITVTCKDPMTISANVIFKIYGTFDVTQNGTLLTLGSSSVVNLYASAGTVSVGSNSVGIKVGTDTVFKQNTSVTATSSTITRPTQQGFGGPLPLKFISFDAVVHSSAVSLSWTATNDGPATAFTIQQSTDGRSWSDIATVSALGGDHETVSYSYEATAPKTGTAIYRLRYLGTNESEVVYSASRIVNLGNATAETTAVIGAEAGRIQIGLSTPSARTSTSVIITTMDGRIVYNGQYAADQTSINIPVSATGILVVTITDGNTFKIAQKVAI